MFGRLSKAAVAAFLVVGITPGAAQAVGAGTSATAQASAGCYVHVGSVTAAGDHAGKLVTVGAASTDRLDTGVYPPGAVRVSGSMQADPDVIGYGAWIGGYTVLGSSMYSTSYYLTLDGDVDRTRPTTYLVGGGWGDTTFFETTRFWAYPKPPNLTTQYQLRANGTLSRWEMQYNNGNSPVKWANKQSATGFASVKTMAMISQTLTYDTFLANTRSGALYTIRIPRTSPMKPIVKKVRGSSWQAFDALVAEKCGQYGTMLVGIDKDTKSAYAYALGHANGTSTVIQGLGKVPGTFADPVYFRRQIREGDAQMLFGE
ncbi:hypothetical protein AB0E69_07885 [Kribbella sp. NPDC026611]|uniref:hypothetical protein n=1 Tax=Kribbella sp. NPDC026611 TaxID=3154911 RepID=UPI0033D5443F